ncbi:hypothetical protein [Streptomyces sp. NPDC002078]
MGRSASHASARSFLAARELAAAAAVHTAADQLPAQAQQETGTARRAATVAEQATGIKERIKAPAGRSWIALRLAGTSRAEQQILLAQYTRQMGDAYGEQQRAERAATTVRQQAWQTLRTFPYAEGFCAQRALGEALATRWLCGSSSPRCTPTCPPRSTPHAPKPLSRPSTRL